MVAEMQMHGYRETLKQELGKNLEKIISDFFKEYLKNEFGINNFLFSMPSEGSTYLEKCRTITPEMESILNQFTLLVTEKSIDHALLQIDTEQIVFENIPSMLEKKYVIGCGDDFEIAIFNLFSDQCTLHYVPRIKTTYKNFVQLIMCEDIYKSDYAEPNLSRLNCLFENNLIRFSETDLIIASPSVYILSDLYLNEAISYWHYSESWKKIVDDLERQGFLKYEKTLLSKPERDLFNYILNQKIFSDSLHLRNSYLHGNQMGVDGEDTIHKENYMTFLVLLVCIIIKINDELCLVDLQNKLSSHS